MDVTEAQIEACIGYVLAGVYGPRFFRKEVLKLEFTTFVELSIIVSGQYLIEKFRKISILFGFFISSYQSGHTKFLLQN